MSKSSKMKSSTLARDLCQVFSVFFAILVRLILAAFCVLTVMVVVDKRGDDRYWALTIALILMLVEGAYTVTKRKGRERRWVCLCFGCYLLASVPSIWLLELEKLGQFRSKLADTNTTSVAASLPGGLSTSFELDSDEIIFILENCLVFLLILCRWLLPSGEITRDQLSQLLFVFIGMASDVMELFQLFEEDEVLNDSYFIYVILTVWTVSLCQFTLVLTMSASPEKVRAVGTTEFDGGAEDAVGKGAGSRNKRKRKTLKQFLIQTELWSLVVSILMQDGPFLAVRLYAVFELRVINSTIVFFVLKNTIVVLLLAYRLVVVGFLLSEEDDKDKDDIKKFEPLKESAVAVPDFKGKSGSYNVKQISEESELPGTPMPSPAKSGNPQPNSTSTVFPGAAHQTTTAPKSARRKVSKVAPAPQDQTFDQSQTPAQQDSPAKKWSPKKLDPGENRADSAKGPATEKVSNKEQVLTLSEVEPMDEVSDDAKTSTLPESESGSNERMSTKHQPAGLSNSKELPTAEEPHKATSSTDGVSTDSR